MSRSIKKTSVKGTTSATTEKENKRQANRKLRRITKVELKKSDENLSSLRQISNVWAFAKDGKRFIEYPSKRDLRK